MPSARISESTRRTLKRVAEDSGDSMQDILEKAVELYRRQRFLEQSNRAFEALRDNPEKWQAEQAEREAWDATIADDIDKE